MFLRVSYPRFRQIDYTIRCPKLRSVDSAAATSIGDQPAADDAPAVSKKTAKLASVSIIAMPYFTACKTIMFAWRIGCEITL
jgi:hypothetical protein